MTPVAKVFWIAVRDAAEADAYERDHRCMHCGAWPEAHDSYWAVGYHHGLSTEDYHPNHCPFCGAYHKGGWGGHDG